MDRIRLCSNRRPLSIAELKKISDCLGMDWSKLKEKITKISGPNFMHNLHRKIADCSLMRLLGLVASDGSIYVKKERGKHANYRVSFANKEPRLIDDFTELCKRWLPDKKVGIDLDHRTGVTTAWIYSPLLVHVADYMGLKGLRGKTDLRRILQLPQELISHFIGGYFDGDGHVALYREGGRVRIEIGFTTGEFTVAKQIHLLLKRLGLASKVRRWTSKSTFGTSKLYKVSITDSADIVSFARRVPIKHPQKSRRLRIAEKLSNKLKKRQSAIACAPLKSGKILREIREKYNLKQSDISKWPCFLSMIERGKRIQKDTLLKLINSLERKLKRHDEKLLQKLRSLASNSYYLDRVKHIRWVPASEKWVYNITVEGTHCFIPEGAFVVKNCNGCDIELVATLTPRYDIERLGMLKRATPRHADILVVTGPITRQCLPRLIRIYEQMPEPKLVVAVGSCPATNGVFDGCYNVVGPLDRHVPVDAYVPGCPPKPEAIIDALLKVGERWR